MMAKMVFHTRCVLRCRNSQGFRHWVDDNACFFYLFIYIFIFTAVIVSFPLRFVSITSLNALSDKMQNKVFLVSMSLPHPDTTPQEHTEVGRSYQQLSEEHVNAAALFPVGTILVIHTWS